MGDLFEDIAERIAAARTRALMGERQTALRLLREARLEFGRFRDVLADYPGFLSLQKSLDSAETTLRKERNRDRAQPESKPAQKRKGRSERAA